MASGDVTGVPALPSFPKISQNYNMPSLFEIGTADEWQEQHDETSHRNGEAGGV
jgi:hypothetical protein